MKLLKKFNDLLAIMVLGGIGLLWAFHGRGLITLPGEVLGTLTAAFVLIVQFFFRKAPPEEPPKG